MHSKYLLDREVLRVQDQEPSPKSGNKCTFRQILWQLFGNAALAPHGGFMSLACASAGIRYGLGMKKTRHRWCLDVLCGNMRILNRGCWLRVRLVNVQQWKQPLQHISLEAEAKMGNESLIFPRTFRLVIWNHAVEMWQDLLL